MTDPLEKSQFGEFGGALCSGAATFTPATGTIWSSLTFLADTTITAITILGNSGATASVNPVKAGCVIRGKVTTITVSGSGSLFWATNAQWV